MTEKSISRSELLQKALNAKLAAQLLLQTTAQHRQEFLGCIARELAKNQEEILFHNEIDCQAAKDAGLPSALLDRLTLTPKSFLAMVRSVEEISVLPDPLGEIINEWEPQPGLKIQKIRVPLGVIGMIYESRPNVTVDATALALKAGNAVILKGGSEAINTNRALVKVITQSLATCNPAGGSPLVDGKEVSLSEGAVQLISTTDRQAVYDLLQLEGLIDLVIARGSAEMIRQIRENARVPVLGHGKGLCHLYIDREAEPKMAEEIAFNAKVQRPGVCNAIETLLVHQQIARPFLPKIASRYRQAGVEMRGCPLTREILPEIIPAKDSDWNNEYLALIINIRTVHSLEEALQHIRKYGSGHSEAIVTGNQETANIFLKTVDAAAVFHNASTRLHDGGVFGLGAEIGISTQKLHARGTMGVKDLTTTKYIVYGKGNIRE